MTTSCARLNHSFRKHEIVVTGVGGLLALISGTETLASFQLSTSSVVSNIILQPLDVLGRFGDDLLYFWVDCSSGMDPRVDLMCLKLGIDNSTGSERIYSTNFHTCFCVDDSAMLIDSSLLGIQSMGSVYGSNSILFFHFKSRKTATVQTVVLDATVVLGHAEKVRKGEPTRFTPCFTSVQTVPVPVDANNLTPISCVTLAGTVAVVRVYPLLAATTGGYGEDPSTPSSESMVLSCSYSVIISYGTAGLNPSVIVTKCMSSLVTAEFQVLSLLKYRGVGILADPDCEVTLSHSTELQSGSSCGYPEFRRTVRLATGQLQADKSAHGPKRSKLYQLCLDFGLILRDRRDFIDKLVKGEVKNSKLAEKLSKTTARRIILLETCISCDVVNSICEYITAFDSSRFGYKISGNSKASGIVYSYEDLEASLNETTVPGTTLPREATAGGIDVGYILRDITRVHQWAVLLLDQLRSTAKDTILRRFVVPFLLAKGDRHEAEGNFRITDMPVTYTRELASYIRLCEGSVAIFRSLITRKIMEVNKAAEVNLADSGVVVKASWLTTSLLDGQCVVAEAVVAVLRIAALACSARNVSLPVLQKDGTAQHPLVVECDRRSLADTDYSLLAESICDIQSWVGDVTFNFFKDGSSCRLPDLHLLQDLIVQYVEKFTQTIIQTDSDDGSIACRQGYLELIFGDASTWGDISPSSVSRHSDRLTSFLFTPVAIALAVQSVGVRSAAPKLGLELQTSAASREEALDVYYVPMRYAFSLILYNLLDSMHLLSDRTQCEKTIVGFAGKFGVACGMQTGDSVTSSFLFPPCWSSGIAALWLIDAAYPTADAMEILKFHNFEALFQCRSGAFRVQNSAFLPIPPETLFRYVLCRFLHQGNWKAAKELLQSQTSSGGTLGRMGETTYDISPLISSQENRSQFNGSSRARCFILSLGMAMLQLDEWQIAWHTTRKLCIGQNDSIRVSLIDMFVDWLFLNNKATEFVNFPISEEDHLVLESKLLKHAKKKLQLTGSAKASTAQLAKSDNDNEHTSMSFLTASRAAEAVDIYILYLLSRSKIAVAERSAQDNEMGQYISTDVLELLSANAAAANIISPRELSAVLFPTNNALKHSAPEQDEALSISELQWESPDSVSTFERIFFL